MISRMASQRSGVIAYFIPVEALSRALDALHKSLRPSRGKDKDVNTIRSNPGRSVDRSRK